MLKLKLLFLCFSSSLCFASWTASPPQPISAIYTFTYQSVYNTCNPATGMYLAAWANGNNNQYPTYSFYSASSGWSPIDTISTSSGALVSTNVFTSCDRVSGKFLATWTDSTTHFPTVSVYTPSVGWSAAEPLITTVADVETFNSYDSTSDSFLVTWADTSNLNFPSYALYTPGSGWSSVGTISTTSPAANVYTAFDPTTNTFLAVWVDIGTGNPKYSFFNSGSWSATGLISPTASVDNDILCACDPSTGRFMATWSDINQSLFPFYSVYTPGIGWSVAATISTTSGAIDNVTLTFDPASGQFLAAWSNSSNGHPTYSFYIGNGWTTPAVISNTATTGSDVFTSYNPISGQFLTAWADNSNPDLTFTPTYSFLSQPVAPPTSFTGTIIYNRFLTQTDIIHKLMWTPSNDSSVVSYRITRNGVLLAVVPASGPLVYYDHDQSATQIVVYTIVSVDDGGDQSTVLTVSL